MSEKSRILEVTATLKPAGAEHLVVSLASALDPDRFEVAVVSLFDAFPDGLEPALYRSNIPVWHLGKHAGPDPRMYSRLSRVVNTFQPHIIHTHCYVTRYTLLLRAQAIVHTVHNMALLEADPVGRAINRYAFRHRVIAVGVGAAVAESLREVYDLPHPLSIPNGIDTQRFWRPESRVTWRERNGFSDQDLLIVSVARLDRQKNPGALVRAISCIPEAQLVLVGQGDLRSELEGQPRVHLLGVRDDIPEILAAADIFALSSDWEGLPLALIEAMAAGLPVVATAVGCVPEVVEDGVSGLLINRGDQAELVAALTSLARDSALRRRMGEAARRRSEAFSLQAMVSAYERLFAELLSSTASGRT